MFDYIDLLLDLYNYFRIQRSAQDWVKSAGQDLSQSSFNFPISDDSFDTLEEQDMDVWDNFENDITSEQTSLDLGFYFECGPGSWKERFESS